MAPVITGQSGSPAQRTHDDEILNGVIDLDVVREMLTHFPYRDHQEAQELILSALQEINEHFGWVSLPAADVVAEHFGTSASRIYGLLTFYADFRTQPRGRHFMLLCHGMACYVLGSQRLVQDLEDTYGIRDGGTTADGELTVQVVNGCLGACDIAPLCKLDADFHGELTVEKLNAVIRDAIAGDGTWRDAHPHPAANGSSHG
ncbi:MAG: NAD(P)H-dependent oxidoreductase subunit E [Thermomicrobiales bacterium]